MKSESYSVEISNSNEACPLGCGSKHLLTACPSYQAASVDERWGIVRDNKLCRKCLQSHHTNRCLKHDGTTCDKCDRRHHQSLHDNGSVNTSTGSNAQNVSELTSNNHIEENRKLTGLLPIQKIKIKDEDGNPLEFIATIDSGSNTSFLSKNAAKKLGLKGCDTHLKMNLAGGKTKAEMSEILDITVVSPGDETIEKSMSVYTLTNLCSPAKTISKASVNKYVHLRPISDKSYLGGGKVNLLIGTDFADAFVDIHIIQGMRGEPIAKLNCFGWYLLGEIDNLTRSSNICSVDVSTINTVEDMKALLSQDLLGVRPTELCSCRDNVLKENKFVKSITKSTKIVDGRVQVRMPWNDSGPPLKSNYETAYVRMLSTEKTFQKKNCSAEIQEEINKLVEQDFVKEIPLEQVNHNEPEWYLPVQAVFTPDRSTKIRLVFDASAKGPCGKSLNEHLEKGPNYPMS